MINSYYIILTVNHNLTCSRSVIKPEDEQSNSPATLQYSIDDPRTSVQGMKVPREPILITEK